MAHPEEFPLCKGCGGRMSQQDFETGTHPVTNCYRERIKRLCKKVEDLRKEVEYYKQLQKPDGEF